MFQSSKVIISALITCGELIPTCSYVHKMFCLQMHRGELNVHYILFIHFISMKMFYSYQFSLFAFGLIVHEPEVGTMNESYCSRGRV